MYNPRSSYSSPTVLGIDERWERVLCYVFGWVTGLIFYFVEQRNATVRRHAMQSMLVFGGLNILTFALGIFSHIPLIGLLFFGVASLVGLVSFVAWIGLMIVAYLSPTTPLLDLFNRRTHYM